MRKRHFEAAEATPVSKIKLEERMKFALGACVEAEAMGSVSARRRLWTADEKRRIVEQTLSSDSSVAMIARQHGVNANQVFYLRKLYRAGQLGANEPSEGVQFLPVSVAEDEPSSAAHRIEELLPWRVVLNSSCVGQNAA